MNSESRDLHVLSETPLFSGVSLHELSALVEHSQRVAVPAGKTLFWAGDASRGLFVVLSGRTRALRQGQDGREQIIHEEGPGATFSEVAVFDDGPYPSTVVAVEDSVLLSLPKQAVRDFCLEHPRVALNALGILSRRLRAATGMVEGFALRRVSQRLCEFLLDEAERLGGSLSFELTHTNQEVADRIGTVREVISRTITRLQARGWIRRSGRRIEILDKGALESHCQRH